MRWAGRQKEKGKRQKEEAEQLLLAEAALSTLARVERAPELGADLRRRITGTRVGGLRWGWVGAGAAAMIMIVVAVAVWPRGEGEGMRSGRREAQVAEAGVRAAEAAARMQRKSAGRPGEEAATRAPAGVSTDERLVPAPTRGPRRGGDADTSPPLRPRSAQAYSTAVAPGTGLPQEQEQAAFAAAPAERESPAEPIAGVILVLGRPEPVLPSGSCYIEVTRADGTRTVREQTVERDAAGRPQMVQISYEQMEPNAASAQQGG